MNVLEQVKSMQVKEVVDKIAAAKIKDAGIYAIPLTDGWKEAISLEKEGGHEMQLVVGLNNADTQGAYLELLRRDADKVMTGMKIAAYALGTEKMILHIPEYAKNLSEHLTEKAKEHGVVIKIGLVDRRAYKSCAINHIVAMADLFDLFAGTYQEGVYLSVNGGKLQKVPSETKLFELVQADHAKAIEIGYRYEKLDVLEKTVGEADIANGIIRTLTEDQKRCVVKETEQKLLEYRRQSCGKCVFCREGLLQLQMMHKDITDGKGKPEYPELIEEIGKAMTTGATCSLGQQSSHIALSAFHLFDKDYDLHIKKKKCPAGVCFSAITIYIDPNICDGCGECIDICPVDCIEGKSGYIHMVDPIDCTQCGKCIEVCEAKAVIQTDGRVPKLPNRLTKVGRFKKH